MNWDLRCFPVAREIFVFMSDHTMGFVLTDREVQTGKHCPNSGP